MCATSSSLISVSVLRYHIRATGAFQSSGAVSSLACVTMDGSGPGPLLFRTPLVFGSFALTSCSPSATCVPLINSRYLSLWAFCRRSAPPLAITCSLARSSFLGLRWSTRDIFGRFGSLSSLSLSCLGIFHSARRSCISQVFVAHHLRLPGLESFKNTRWTADTLL
jgi:hypothetical protein